MGGEVEHGAIQRGAAAFRQAEKGVIAIEQLAVLKPQGQNPALHARKVRNHGDNVAVVAGKQCRRHLLPQNRVPFHVINGHASIEIKRGSGSFP